MSQDPLPPAGIKSWWILNRKNYTYMYTLCRKSVEWCSTSVCLSGCSAHNSGGVVMAALWQHVEYCFTKYLTFSHSFSGQATTKDYD